MTCVPDVVFFHLTFLCGRYQHYRYTEKVLMLNSILFVHLTCEFNLTCKYHPPAIITVKLNVSLHPWRTTSLYLQQFMMDAAVKACPHHAINLCWLLTEDGPVEFTIRSYYKIYSSKRCLMIAEGF